MLALAFLVVARVMAGNGGTTPSPSAQRWRVSPSPGWARSPCWGPAPPWRCCCCAGPSPSGRAARWAAG
ncbi:hypothetical protein [Teichococcus aestuarii]|uniref:hypothetical protein n=1 Tax=Teichococcus aestuarii TaxID=568898 RepID=UPI0036155FA9